MNIRKKTFIDCLLSKGSEPSPSWQANQPVSASSSLLGLQTTGVNYYACLENFKKSVSEHTHYKEKVHRLEMSSPFHSRKDNVKMRNRKRRKRMQAAELDPRSEPTESAGCPGCRVPGRKATGVSEWKANLTPWASDHPEGPSWSRHMRAPSATHKYHFFFLKIRL